MENKINIAELLKDAPRGTKFYSTIFGEVKFLRLGYNQFDKLCEIIVEIRGGEIRSFYKDGRLSDFYEDAECTLFPSKDCRTWENFKVPWKHQHFEPFQRVLVRCNSRCIWGASIYSHYWNNIQKHITITNQEYSDENIIPYKGNEDKLGKDVE